MNNAGIRKPENSCALINIASAPYRKFMEDNGYKWGELSAGKEFPSFIMNCSVDNLKRFIRAYMDAEACFSHNKGVIEMSTASPILASQMFILLKRFGINSRILKKRKCATNGKRIYRDYYEVHISGPSLRIYHDKVGFGVDYKQEGLVDVCENRRANTNTEIIPMHAELSALRDATMISKGLITNKANFYGKTNPSVDECAKIKDRLDKLLDMPEDEVAWKLDGRLNYMTSDRKKHVRVFKKFLKSEIAKEVCYIAIKSIEKVEYDGYLYSLEVGRHGNFVAEGTFCHSLSVDSD